MNKKEIFYRFVKNGNVTPEEYMLAKSYYLEEACEEEKRLYDSFLNILVPSLQKAYNKSEMHLIVLAKKHGMSKEEALELIRDFQNSNSDGFLIQLQKQGVNEEEYLRFLYLSCYNFIFCKSKIEDFLNNLGINYKLFLDLVKVYLKKYLKLSKGDIIEFFNKFEISEDFHNFLSSKIGNNFNNVLYYYRTFATEEERTAFRNILNEITSEFYQDDLSTQEIAKEMEAKYSIPLTRAKKKVSEYRKRKENESLNKYRIVCEMFFNYFPYEKIQEYINNSNISLEYLKENYLDNYVKRFNSEHMRQMAYNRILLRIQEYMLFKRKIRKSLKDKLKNELVDNQTFMDAKEMISMIVYDDYKDKDFIKKFGEVTFYYYVTIVEMYDSALYNLYTIRKYKKVPDVDDKVVNSLIYYINNGILENGVLREFNILDYFRMVRLPIDIFIDILQGYDNKVKQVIVSFLLKNKSRLHPLTDAITSSVDPDEDSIVKKYMILNDLPMFDLVYMLVLEEYHAGVLILEKNSRK